MDGRAFELENLGALAMSGALKMNGTFALCWKWGRQEYGKRGDRTAHKSVVPHIG